MIEQSDSLPLDGRIVRLTGQHARQANTQLSLSLEFLAEHGKCHPGERINVYWLAHARDNGFCEPPTLGEYAIHLQLAIPELGCVSFGFCSFQLQEPSSFTGAEDERNAERLRAAITGVCAHSDDAASAGPCWKTEGYSPVYSWHGSVPGGACAR